MKTYASKIDKFNYLGGFANFVVVSLVVWFLWRLFFHPEPIFKIVLSYYRLSLEVVFLSSIAMIVYVIGYYPATIEKMNPVYRGVLILFIATLLAAIIYFIIFRNFIGRFAVAYFSPDSIIASGGIGAEPLVARYQSSLSIFYFHIGFLWIASFWKLGAGNWPWNNCTRRVVASSRFITIMLLTIIVYVTLFHPHICYLFYPPQNKAAVEPWWANIAGTGSAHFHLGWLLCTLSWIIISMFLWEGYPWKIFNKNGKGSIARVVVTFLGTLALGIITLIILMKAMNIFWDEAFPGGKYTDGIDFRYIHTGEICSFFILVTFILKSHFNNFPNKFGIWGRASLRSAITIVGGLIIYFIYYSRVGEFFLGFETGYGFPTDTPLFFVMLFLFVILIHDEFFKGWPIKKEKV